MVQRLLMESFKHVDTRQWINMDTAMWTRLPDTVLIEIYFCLHDKERVNMALTCKHWNRIFTSPCLWRTRYVELGGYRYTSAGEKAFQFADIHGAHLRYLFLSCNYPSSHSCRVIQKTIEVFLQKILNAKLIYFELERVNVDSWKLENLEAKVVKCFTRFFRYQRRMRNFRMGNWRFSLNGGCRILEAVGSASGSTLMDLDIEDFFHSKLEMFQEKRFKNSLAMFTNLSCLSLNCNCLSNDILECMSRTLAGTLKTINCTIYRTDPHVHQISSHAWRNLKAACPELSVDLYFGSFGFSSDISWILVPQAPVRKIHLSTSYNDNADLQLNETIDHIAIHHKQIAVLSIELDSNYDSISNSLVSMVTECKALRELYVNAFLTVAAIDEICSLQRERKIDLHTFHVTTHRLTESQYAELMYIKEKHFPVMQQLDFKITCDYLTDVV